MYYQTKSVSKDNCWTSCTIKDVTEDNNYIVEYTESGEIKTTVISPEQIQNLEYSELDISQ